MTWVDSSSQHTLSAAKLHTRNMGYRNELPRPFRWRNLREGFYFTEYDAGPFKSSKYMEDWFNDRLHVYHDFGHAGQTPPGSFAGRFGDLIMCHLDIHLRNPILDGQNRLCLIDWAFSGAYAPYFDTAHLTLRGLIPGLAELVGRKTPKEEVGQLLAIVFALSTGANCQPRWKAKA